jgi:hypothetical protein
MPEENREHEHDKFEVTLVYANTGEEVEVKVPGSTTGADLLALAYKDLHKTPQPNDRFEIQDQVVTPTKTVAEYARESDKKELEFEITNPTGGA